MEKKDFLHVDTNKASSMVSAINFKPEKMYKAFSAPAHTRKLYVAISVIEELDDVLYNKIREMFDVAGSN